MAVAVSFVFFFFYLLKLFLLKSADQKDGKKDKAGRTIPPTGTIVGTAKGQQSSVNESNQISSPFADVFNWEDYLKETSSTPAPPSCFRQVCSV